MNNFIFQNPTRLIFGRGMIAQLAKQIPADKKIMVTFGGGSVKQNGVYDQVVEALKDHDYIEFWGIEPNPRVETLRRAIAECREKNIDFLLAVGGGSVLDGTKLIAAAIHYEGDAWDILLNNKVLREVPVVPFASVMTLPATGSEMNNGAVISNESTREKFSFYTDYPRFSILDPETTYSLPKAQVSAGLSDTFVHVMEQYMTTTGQSRIMDRWAEGVLQTLVEIAPLIMKNQHNYDTMADFMLSATMGLNHFLSMGVSQDWATHMIGHELTAIHSITHGHTLAIVLPALLRVQREQKKEKLLQYGSRVWNITGGSEDKRIEKTIEATENFFRSIGLSTRLGEVGIGEDTIAEIERRFRARGAAYGERGNVDGPTTRKILEAAL